MFVKLSGKALLEAREARLRKAEAQAVRRENAPWVVAFVVFYGYIFTRLIFF